MAVLYGGILMISVLFSIPFLIMSDTISLMCPPVNLMFLLFNFNLLQT